MPRHAVRSASLAVLIGVVCATIIPDYTPVRSGTTATDAVARVRALYVADLAALDTHLELMEHVARDSSRLAARAALLRTRLAYKRVEWLAEHYTPLTARALNGPAADRPDDESPLVTVHATGLQVMESMLYAESGPRFARDSLLLQVRIARVNVRRLGDRALETTIVPQQLFDAARIQLARVESLGLAGFDTPFHANAMPEAATSLEAVTCALASFRTESNAASRVRWLSQAAARYLMAHTDFNTFDRFEFILSYASPLARGIDSLRSTAGVGSLTDRRPWRANSASVFDADALDPFAFAPPGSGQDQALAGLGARLFHDTRLSAGSRSCATCHQPAKAFTDGLRTPRLVSSASAASAQRPRNTPTLLNAALQGAALADGRAAFLEDQVTLVVNDPREMGGNLLHAAEVLANDPAYARDFARAVGAVQGAEANARVVRRELAAYVRSLVRVNAPFDRAVRGESPLNADARLGFNLFMGKARCGTCHFAPLFNGTAPPAFEDAELEVIGVPAEARGRTIDPDLGAGARDGSPFHMHAFRTPTVRNAAVTSPYMHNGVFPTLADVIEFYDVGGGAGRGTRTTNQSRPSRRLHLTRREKLALQSFIESLTDTSPAGPA